MPAVPQPRSARHAGRLLGVHRPVRRGRLRLRHRPAHQLQHQPHPRQLLDGVDHLAHGLVGHHDRLRRPLGERVHVQPEQPRRDHGREVRREPRADAELQERPDPASAHRRRRQHLHRSRRELQRAARSGRVRGADPEHRQLLLRRSRLHLRGRRRFDDDPQRLDQQPVCCPGPRPARRDRRGGLPARPAADQVHPAVRRRGARRQLVRAGDRRHPGHRGQHAAADRLQRRRDLRPVQHRERL